MTSKTKRRMPWRKVGHELWTDEAGHGLSGLAIAIRVMFEARSTGDDAQLVNGKAMPQAGWMLRESGAPLTVAKISLLARFPEQDVIAALAELEAEEIVVRSDSGAWGVAGWASRQEDESAERKRQQREREAKRDVCGTRSDKSVTDRGLSVEKEEEEEDDERKTEDREPESRAAAAIRLVTELAALHPHTADSSQRWKPKNRAHLAAAEALLALDSDPGWPDEAIDLVSDFSAICAQDREQAKFWLAPHMLALVPSPKSTSGKSRWDTIRSVVAAWRAERRAHDDDAHQRRERERASERKRVEDRMAELEGLALHGEPAFARQLRESGQKSTPVVDHKACFSAAQEAIAAARRGGRDPTLEEIERAVKAAQETRTK